ncbi:MAG: hypothetical protein KDE08_04065 [Rhodobacteraceae bacterium]|nr:hypothetical protein [Paracoccaceae bacterium]
MWATRRTAAVLMALVCAGPALPEEPLSAIDWLSKSVATPGLSPGQRILTEPPISDGAMPGKITVMSLDGPSLDALGLLPSSRTGLPYTLWGQSTSEEIARLVRSERIDTLPSVQALLDTLLLAELAPPADSNGSGMLFLARVDKLLDLGSLDEANSLLELVDNPRPEVFRRWFDIALLLGEEDIACSKMVDTPEIAPTFPARVFCLARAGDWNAAALSLRTGETLGYIDTPMAELLSRFLDPDLYEDEPQLPTPARPTPLVFRLMEAIGQPIQTTTLPLAFAQADLRSNAGWKTRLEAGERLARTGAIGENLLLGLYSERKAAASGGVWERVKAIQALEKALQGGNKETVARELQVAWPQMTQMELEVPFAELFGPAMNDLALPGTAGALAFRIGLLSSSYEAVAQGRQPQASDEPFLIGLATGEVAGLTPPDQLGEAIRLAFEPTASFAAEVTGIIDSNRLGQAILRAIDDITEGARGDLRRVSEGLFILRQTGLESSARRAALELLLLERRG